jgi:hypothetical protein
MYYHLTLLKIKAKMSFYINPTSKAWKITCGYIICSTTSNQIISLLREALFLLQEKKGVPSIIVSIVLCPAIK